MSVAITITNAGLAELVAASHAGSAAITITQIGITASVVAADPTLTALPAEIKRINTFSGMVVAADVIHIGMEDNSPDAYSMYSFGLYLADGTLFALYGQASPIYTKTAASIGLLAVDITFTAGVASAITFGAAGFLNPPASTTVMGVVQLATQAQANAGTDATDVLTPATAKAAVMGWLPYTPVQAGGGVGDLPGHAIIIGWTGATLRAQVDTVDIGPLVLASQLATSSAPGIVQLASSAQAIAGTDTADALTPATAAAAFTAWFSAANVLSGFTCVTDGNGNWKETRPNGVIEMWGIVTTPHYSEGGASLPLPFGGFPTAITDFSASVINSSGSGTGATTIQEVSLTTTTANIYIQDNASSGFGDDYGGLRWRAKGY